MSAQKIAYNVIFSSAAKVISVALALVSIGFITRYLGTEGFGEYSTVVAFLSFFAAILDLGLNSISTREISRKEEETEKIIGNILSLRIVSSLVAFVIVPFIFLLFPYPMEVKRGIAIIAASFFLSSTYQVLNGVFQRSLAMDKVAMSELIGRVVQVAVVVLAVKLNLGFDWIILAIFFNMLASLILVFIWSRKYIQLKLRADFSYWKEFLRESFPMGAVAIITFLYYKLDTILLSVMRPSADVGIYNVAYKIIDNVTFFPGMFMGLIMPIMAKNFFADKEKFRRVSDKTFKVFTVLVIPLVVGTFFLAEDIIHIIGGTGFEESANVLRILIFALAFIFFGNFFNSIMVAGNFQKKLMYILGLAAAVNITLNLIFIPKFSYMATSFNSVITEFLVAVLTFWAVAKKTGYLPKIEKLGGILFSGLMMAATLFFFRGANFFALFFGSSAVYFFFLWAFRSIKTDEIKSLLIKNERENIS